MKKLGLHQNLNNSLIIFFYLFLYKKKSLIDIYGAHNPEFNYFYFYLIIRNK
jgi:hypothetical protein